MSELSEPAGTQATAARRGTPRVAVIGCGAIAENFHLPGLARHQDVMRESILVDLDEARAGRLASQFGARTHASDYRDVLDEVDGVILTVPHHLHYPMALECLQRGLHVLCEKPIAGAANEVEDLVRTAEAHHVTIGVNNTKRLYPSFRRMRELIREGAIGEPRRLTALVGEKFDWPAATGFYMGVGGTRGGILLDQGPHALDLVCWWLGGRPTVVRYLDDSAGGIEAVASVYLKHGSCEGEVHLSWLSRYDNGYRIEGTEGALQAGLYDWQFVTILDARGRSRRVRLKGAPADGTEFGVQLVTNFLETMRGEATPLVPAGAVADSIALIDECRAKREPYRMPWMDVRVGGPSV